MPPVAKVAPTDGRRARAERTRFAVLAACRALMRGGEFRPSMVAVATVASVSTRSVFAHFPSTETLHLEAIEDRATAEAILRRVRGDLDMPLPADLARAIVLGRAG